MPDLRARRREQTRREVGEVALRLFAERGYDDVTVAEIAEAAGISRRTFFTHFASKDEVLLVGSADDLTMLEQALEQRGPGESFLDVFRAHAGRRMEHEQAQAERRRLRRRVDQQHPELAARTAAHRALAEQRLVRPHIARDLGTTPDDPRVAIVAGAFVGAGEALSRLLEDPGEDSPEALMHLALDVLAAAMDRARSPR